MMMLYIHLYAPQVFRGTKKERKNGVEVQRDVNVKHKVNEMVSAVGCFLFSHTFCHTHTQAHMWNNGQRERERDKNTLFLYTIWPG